MKTNLASFEKVTKRYSEFTLDHIDLKIEPGRIVGIIGPNGAGKTTTLKLMMNIIKPNSGSITMLGRQYPTEEREIKNKIGYVGEEQYFYEDRTVSWTGRFVSRFYTEWDENRFNQLLMQFQISRTKKVKALSNGMRVKLSLAIALSHHASLILLDEPTAGLDPVVRREVLTMLKNSSLDDPELGIVISSHITDDLERIADTIHYMINGKIALTDEKDILLDNWKKLHFRTDSVDETVLTNLYNIERNQFGCSGITNQYQTFRQTHAEGIAKDTIRVENVHLDDILLSLLEE